MRSRGGVCARDCLCGRVGVLVRGGVCCRDGVDDENLDADDNGQTQVVIQ